LKEHGKVFIALSLDGHDDAANISRFHNNGKLLKKVFALIELLVSKEIPLMLLCTLNAHNINKLPEYVTFLEEKFLEPITKGMLVMPAHSVTNYKSDKILRPPRYSCDNLMNFIRFEGHKHPIINKIKDHYEHLAYFMDNYHRYQPCSINNWLLSVHFRDNEILTDGKFYTFGCGMRGVEELGIFEINNEKSINQFVQKVGDLNLMKLFHNPLTVPYVCQQTCFVDWVAFDFILSNVLSLEQAKDWFVLFRDPQVQLFVKKYIDNLI
jgi:hypothetical protein